MVPDKRSPAAFRTGFRNVVGKNAEQAQSLGLDQAFVLGMARTESDARYAPAMSKTVCSSATIFPSRNHLPFDLVRVGISRRRP